MLLEAMLDDPSDWPEEHAALRDVDQLLRCPVCKEYFTTAMSAAGCGHTFCSLCVRRCLAHETKCPTCRAPLTESELHPSRLVDSLLRAFVGGRQQLLAAVTAPVPVARKRPRIRTRSAARTERATDAGSEDGIVSSGSTGTGSDGDFAPTEGRLQPAKGRPAVPCPNCQQAVAATRINWHLDRCLAGRPTATKASGTAWGLGRGAPGGMHRRPHSAMEPTLPRPTKLVYSLLSEAKLRRTLRDLGIPSKGDKQQMQARHVEWVNMYLANADADTPVAHRLLLRRLAAWEEALARPAEASKHSQADSAADHAAKYADAFAVLVAQAQGGGKRSG
ncbi:E3 ubiquitin-protein ligase rad18 [Coemansia spiralis]|nr:E3 ubiquitin-protein ligase rad18 [Coemansia spiralis]